METDVKNQRRLGRCGFAFHIGCYRTTTTDAESVNYSAAEDYHHYSTAWTDYDSIYHNDDHNRRLYTVAGERRADFYCCTGGGDIVETARQAGTFNTLVSLLETTGLAETLKGAGPYTVFAPTDEAFAKLPASALADLSKPENKEKLKAILTYHVVPGKVMAADVAKLDGKTAKTVQGGELPISTASGVKIGNAMVSKADIVASNGVIHVIDTVLMPSSAKGGTQ
ncbi:MAG: fasciclin domain-containing protein [Pyrinomonadaceae bacterium]